jgi:hypothetical protein
VPASVLNQVTRDDVEAKMTAQPSEAKEEVTPVTGDIKRVGRELYEAMRALTVQIPTRSKSPNELARVLKVHRTLASRLLNAIRTDDPLAAVSRMPRSEGLRIFLQAAKSRVSPDTHGRADMALRTFEQVVKEELGGWDGFDAAITEWLPDARARFEIANKQLAFKGVANLMGVRADTQLDTVIYYPDASGQKCDIVLVEGLTNLHRLRPSACVPVASHIPHPHAPQPLECVMGNRDPDDPRSWNPLLKEFCSKPYPELEVVKNGDMVTYVLAGNEIGANAAVDVFAANMVRSGRPLYRAPGEPPTRPHWSVGVNLPTKTLVMNVLLHEDVWPGDPELLLYDIHIRGLSTPGDPARDLDRLDMMESIQPLGKGAARFRLNEVGRNAEMVQYLCDRLGWDSNRLRGYRVRVQYPLMHVAYCVAFQPLPLREA